uniref:Integrase catalytic domain-containing protein n=1 Tax=Tanacetum cinerariifolium TaxID=118510 RepID=A0A6L2LT96_TANCI|nr:hypothetical protein [Tanacetum cinerariifolium]
MISQQPNVTKITQKYVTQLLEIRNISPNGVFGNKVYGDDLRRLLCESSKNQSEKCLDSRNGWLSLGSKCDALRKKCDALEFDIKIRDKKGAKNLATGHLFRLENHETEELNEAEIDDRFPDESIMNMDFGLEEQWFADFANYLAVKELPNGITIQEKKKFFFDLKYYFWDDPHLFKGPTGGHHRANTTAKKGIDFMGPFPTSYGNKYILVAIDYVSKWAEAQALPTNDARVVVKFLNRLFSRFGIPKALISDRVGHFCNHQLEKALQRYGVTRSFSIAYHPQTSGQVKMTNRLWHFDGILREYTLLGLIWRRNGQDYDSTPNPLKKSCIHSVETASRVPSDSVTIYKAKASEILRRRQNARHGGVKASLRREAWPSRYETDQVLALGPYRISDHSPAILGIHMLTKIKPKPFKFSNILIHNTQFKDVVHNSWQMDVSGFWMFKVKAKIEWLHVGDYNTAYFHKAVKSRAFRNRIDSITTPSGTCIDRDQVPMAFTDHYMAFLGQKGDTHPFNSSDLFCNKLYDNVANHMIRVVC